MQRGAGLTRPDGVRDGGGVCLGVVRSSKHNYEQQLTESSVSAPVQSRVQVDVVIAGAVRLDRGERAAAAAAVGVVVVN